MNFLSLRQKPLMKHEDSPSTKQIFYEKLSQLEQITEAEQKQKIVEMNKMIDGMNKEEFKSVFTEETFNKIEKMIEEKKMSIKNAILLPKHVGYCNVLNELFIDGFDYSSLSKRFGRMIIEENKKKEEKNEKLLIDLCECSLMLCFISINEELLAVCVPCLLKAALKKEENEETQMEVEMIFLILSMIVEFKIKQELFLTEIKEIIKYHQEHNNLTRLAYQSAWQFLIKRLFFEQSLEMVIVNELHFAREARREVKELMKSIDLKKKEKIEVGKVMKEEDVSMRWLETIEEFLCQCEMWNEEYAELIHNIVQLFLASKKKYTLFRARCIELFSRAAFNKTVKIGVFLKEGIVDLFLEEIQEQTLDDEKTSDCLKFFKLISIQLKDKKKDEMEEVERKELKRKVFEKMEEEGYEDIIIGFHETFDFLQQKYFYELSSNIFNYFVFI